MIDALGVSPYLLHPMLVHFPIALLVLGFAAGLAMETPWAPVWFGSALAWMLGLGTGLLWAALALGLLAERLAPHVPLAWRTLAAHKGHAWVTVWAFSALCLVALLLRGRGRRWLLAGWALALTQLVVTAHLGAQLVFTYGMGSAQP